jgi:transglutaminase-like putative cysteine protease
MPMLRSTASKHGPEPLSPYPLSWLTLALCLSLLPHIARIPIWLSLTAAAAVIYMLLTLYWKLPRPKTWILWILVLMCVIGVGAYYGKLLGRDSGVSLLVVMLSLKLLETRRHRDGMVIIGLIYFSIMTHFLYDQTIPLFFFMLLAVAVNTLALIALNENTARIAIRQKIRLVGGLLLSALPIMLLLFILFPRIPGPIWGLPQDVYSARSGLSDTMSPGDFSNVALSDEIAFRVVFADQNPTPAQLYWRTLILGDFDGRTWRLDDKPLMAEPERLMAAGDPLRYTVTVEPHQRRWLYALDMPVSDKSTTLLNGEKLYLTSERLLRTLKPVVNLTQYSALSYPHYRLNPELTRYQRQRALQLPAHSNPRAVELAASWRDRTQQPMALAELALDLFRQDFTYTLKPPILGLHSIDEFLFVSKRGFCEHFASSFVFLMRAAGVPARVVTGYQGGELNPLDNYFLIRQSDAHAWAEVWIEDYGWRRVDPTNAVSPARIELGIDEAIPLSERPGFFLRQDYPFIHDLGMIWDAIDNRWNLWVLGYGPETQLEFLSKLGLKNANPYNMIFAMLIGTLLLLIIIGLLNLRRRMFNPDDVVHNVYLRFCAELSKMGYTRWLYEGPTDFALRIKAQNPALGVLLEPVFILYARLRYGRRRIPQASRMLRRKVRTVRHSLKKVELPTRSGGNAQEG